MSQNRWFRFYDAVLDDPKVQKLPPVMFKAWVNVLCIASRNGGQIPNDMADLGFALRMSEEDAADMLHSLAEAGLIDNDNGMRPHNWGKRQFQSDQSTERVKRHRDRYRNGDETASETPPDTDSEADTEQKEVEARAAPAKRGSRLPEDWAPSVAGIAFAIKLCLNTDTTLAKFRDHWTAATGQSAVKLDWDAAWRTWCRKEIEFARNKPSTPATRGAYAAPISSDEHRRLVGYAQMIKAKVSPGQQFTSADRFKLIKSGLITMEDCEKAGCAA